MNSKDLEIKPFRSKLKNSFKGVIAPLPQKHFSAMVIGRRGSGKTIAVRNLLRLYKKIIPKQNRFLISPTCLNDDTLWDYVDDHNMFNYYDDSLIGYILDTIENDEKEQKAKIRMNVIKKMLKLKKYEDVEDIRDLPEDEIEERYDKALKKEFHKQNYVAVFDDCQGLIKQKSEATRLITQHRHHNLSVIYMFQTFREAPVVIRTNSILNIMYDTTHKEIEKYAEEYNNFKTKEQFYEMFEKYVNGYNFLLVDRKASKSKQYYQNFNRFINMDEFKK